MSAQESRLRVGEYCGWKVQRDKPCQHRAEQGELGAAQGTTDDHFGYRRSLQQSLHGVRLSAHLEEGYDQAADSMADALDL